MCDTATIDMIDQIVTDNASAGKLFTAFDVTEEVRNNGITEYHSRIRDEISIMFDSGIMKGYDRTMMNIPNTNKRAFVYHPNYIQPIAYDPTPKHVAVTKTGPGVKSQFIMDLQDKFKTALDNIGNPGVRQAAQRAGVIAKPKKVNAKPIYDKDNKDRICVRARFMKEAGFSPFDTAYVFTGTGNKTLIVAKRRPTGANNICSYTVDHYTNIKISNGALKQLKFSAGLNKHGFSLKVDKDRVVVIPV